MAIFGGIGNETVDGSEILQTANCIWDNSTTYLCNASGDITTLGINLLDKRTSGFIRLAIYKSGTLVGETNSTVAVAGIMLIPLRIPVSVLSGSTYRIAIWADGQLEVATMAAGKGLRKTSNSTSYVYNDSPDFPTALIQTWNNSEEFAIWAVGAPATQLTLTSLTSTVDNTVASGGVITGTYDNEGLEGPLTLAGFPCGNVVWGAGVFSCIAPIAGPMHTGLSEFRIANAAGQFDTRQVTFIPEDGYAFAALGASGTTPPNSLRDDTIIVNEQVGDELVYSLVGLNSDGGGSAEITIDSQWVLQADNVQVSGDHTVPMYIRNVADGSVTPVTTLTLQIQNQGIAFGLQDRYGVLQPLTEVEVVIYDSYGGVELTREVATSDAQAIVRINIGDVAIDTIVFAVPGVIGATPSDDYFATHRATVIDFDV